MNALVSGEQDSPPAAEALRQIVLFYSYKGGVGRTMAMCNVAAYLTENLRMREGAKHAVLCLDLDIEAPSVATFLAKTKLPPECNFVALCQDFAANVSEHTPEQDVEAWLEQAFRPGSKYLRRVREDRDLYVLPTGLEPHAVSGVERSQKAAKILSEGIVGCLKHARALRRVLHRHFAYTLVDCRSGLPDIEFRLAKELCDVFVPFFRPNSTHLFGVKLAFASFLSERGRKVTDRDLPAIPVLSPRPAYTDPRIRQIRTLARDQIFRWLVPEPTSAADNAALPPLSRYEEFVELAFDKTFEIGEQLLVPLGAPDDTDGAPRTDTVSSYDDEAPLFVGYQRLARAIQKGNCERDAIGAELCEEAAMSVGHAELALTYHLCTLRLEPGRLEHWRRLWTHYSDYLERDDTARHHVTLLCQSYRTKGEPAVAAAKSCLWLAEFSKPDPRLGETDSESHRRQRLLAQAWCIARASDQDELSGDVSLHLNRLLRDFPVGELPEPLPSPRMAVAAHAQRVFRDLRDSLSIGPAFETLCFLEEHLTLHPECDAELELALLDQLRIAEQSSLRARIFTDLGNHYRRSMRFDRCVAALSCALREPNCAATEANFAAERLQRLLPLGQWKKQAQLRHEDLSPKLQASLKQKRAEQLTVLSSEDHLPRWGAGARIAQTLDAMRRRDYEAAVGICQARGWGDARQRLPIHALVCWLRGEKHAVSSAIIYDALAIWDEAKGGSVSTFYLAAAWAGDSLEVAQHAARKLRATRWPIDRFWYLFFAASAPEGEDYREELIRVLEKTPLLTRWVRQSEVFFLFREIWKQIQQRSKTAAPSAFSDILKSIEEGVDKSSIPDFDPHAFPSFAENDIGCALAEVATRWSGWAARQNSNTALLPASN